MRSCSLRQFVALAALCLVLRAPAAQVGIGVGSRNRPSSPNQQTNVPTTTVHINGVVVSSLDGKPVARVLVTSMDRRFAALTDWQGKFGFDYRIATSTSATMSPGFGRNLFSVGLILRKPGYVNDNQPITIPTPAPGTTPADLQLKITPSGAITGRVTPDSGELPNGLRAILRRRVAQDGEGSWIQAGSVQIDRDGEFRFADLNPGEYLVQTSAWSELPRSGPENRPDTIRGLLPTYYPTGATPAEATPIRVSPGQTETINLRPTSATFYRISVGVDGPSEPNFGASLQLDNGLGVGANQATHTIEGYLPTGSYTVRIENFSPGVPAGSNRPPAGPRGNRTTSFAHLEVGSAPLLGRAIAAAPPADLQVSVTRNFTNTQPPTIELAAGPPGHSNPPVYIDFRSVDNLNFFSNSQQDVQGDTITIHDIPEGTYHVHINAPQGYVASAMSGSTNLLTTPLTVGPGGSAAPIYITLRDDFASLSCRIQNGQGPDESSGPQQPVFAVAIPLDTPETRIMPVGFSPQPFQGPASPVAPGRYLLLAMRPNQFQTVEYRNPAILHDLMSKGAIITLAPGEKESVDVPILPDGKY